MLDYFGGCVGVGVLCWVCLGEWFLFLFCFGIIVLDLL